MENNVFQIKSTPNGHDMLHEFLTKNFICIGFFGIGDLTNTNKDEIRNRLKTVYGLTKQKLGSDLSTINTFVNTLQKKDIIVIKDGKWLHAGIVGDYRYEKQFDNKTNRMCHVRDVRWFDKFLINSVNIQVQTLLKHRKTISKVKIIKPSPSDIYINEQSNSNKKSLEDLVKIIQTETNSKHPNIKIIKTATELLNLKLQS